MKTIIELYDKENIFNISAAAAIKPENIVFICSNKIGKHRKAPVISLLSKYCPGSQIFFYEADSYDSDSIKKVLDEILLKFPDCAVELTGGTEVLAYGVGKCLSEKTNAFVYNPKKEKIIYISGPCKGKEKDAKLSFDISDFAVMAGGKYLRHGHFNIENFSKELLSDSEKVWKIFLKHKAVWHKQVGYFQAISCGAGAFGSCIKYSGPESVVKKDGGIAFADIGILKELEAEGILKNLNFFANRISFEFKSPIIKNLLNDFGVWLEIFIYKSCVESGKFDNVDMSVVIDWNNKPNEPDDVLNEIDIIVTKGITPLFISCKAGNVSASALNEIKTLTERFGGSYAKSVLVTAEELSSYSLKTYKRATELGIKVIELTDLIRESPAKILERIINNG